MRAMPVRSCLCLSRISSEAMPLHNKICQIGLTTARSSRVIACNQAPKHGKFLSDPCQDAGAPRRSDAAAQGSSQPQELVIAPSPPTFAKGSRMALLPLVSQTIVRTLIFRCKKPLGHFLACTWCLSWAGREASCRLQRETHSRPLLQLLFASLFI